MYICVSVCGSCPQGRDALGAKLQVVVHQQGSNTSSSKSSTRGAWWRTPLILVLRRQRQVEFEISLVYTGSSRAARATEKNGGAA